MPSTFQLQTLLNLARQKVDDAARKLGELTNAQSSASSKLEMLIEYRAEYMAQLDILMQGGISSSAWRNFQSFIGTLDGAIAQQQALVDHAAQMVTAGKDEWRNHKRRQTSYATLTERLHAEEALRQNKKEQRANDEFAARSFRLRATDSNVSI